MCGPCGYIYDPELGDPDGGIAPGTPFEDIPDDWVCPVCGLGKDVFAKMQPIPDESEPTIGINPQLQKLISRAQCPKSLDVAGN